MIYEEEDIAILSVGHMFEEAAGVWETLKEQGFSCTLVNARFVKPLDEEMVEALGKNHRMIVTMEENVQSGGFGEHVLEFVSRKKLPVTVLTIALPDDYVEHGNIDVLRKETGIDRISVAERIMKAYTGVVESI